MTKGQMHVFNWFFLFIIVVIAALHTLMAHVKYHVAVGPVLYIFLLIFALIWLVIYAIQLRSFGTKRGQIGLAINGILTGFWVIVYTFMNGA